MKHSLFYLSCPICRKLLIDLAEDDLMRPENEHMYWCDNCDIDITIFENEEDKTNG